MASIGKDTGGKKRILFVAPDGKRKTLRLGKTDMQTATAVRTKVEALLGSRLSGAMSSELALWVANLDDREHAKLAAVGLLDPRQKGDPGAQMTVGQLCDEYIAGRDDVKERTLSVYQQTRRNLVDCFGYDRPIADLTEHDGDEFRRFLTRDGLNEVTARKRVSVTKQFFKSAVRRRLIPENPFGHLASSAIANPDRYYFVTIEETEKLIEAAPDSEWRTIIALARFGGLRIPSELLALKWSDINWAENKMLVCARKTAGHAGKATRWTPLFPELAQQLHEHFDGAEPGAVYVIERHRDSNTNLRTQLGRIAHRAGLTLWEKPFQNMRSTRATELVERFPGHLVAAWLGHAEAVARKHYLQVRQEDFDRAAQNPAQQNAADLRNGEQTIPEPVPETAFLRAPAKDCCDSQTLTQQGLTPERTRTPNLRFRRPTLYPIELQAHVQDSSVRGRSASVKARPTRLKR